MLTARHCVFWDHNGVVVDGRQVEVWLGSHGREGQDGYKIPVRRIIIRPDYQAPTCARSVSDKLLSRSVSHFTSFLSFLTKTISDNNKVNPPDYCLILLEPSWTKS